MNVKLSLETKLIIKTAFLSAIFTLFLLIAVNYFFNHSLNIFTRSSAGQLFTVQGSSSITEKPDQAQISFIVTKTATTLQNAQNLANTQTNTIVADLKKIGILQKDIKTSNYSSFPAYNENNMRMMPIRIPPPASQTITGYTVSENVDVTLNNIGKANNVIDTITKDGAENISGPNLTFSETSKKLLVNKARIQAISDAKQKAQAMADAAGIHLGRIVSIQENNTPYQIQPMMYGKVTSGAISSVPTQINPGENTITETVTLSFETW